MQNGEYEIQIKLPDYLFNSQGQVRGRIVQNSSKFVLNDKTVIISCVNTDKQNNTDPNKFVAKELFDKVFKNFNQKDIAKTFDILQNAHTETVNIKDLVAAACYGAWILEINKKIKPNPNPKIIQDRVERVIPDNKRESIIETYLRYPIFREQQDREERQNFRGHAYPVNTSNLTPQQLCPTIKMSRQRGGDIDINMQKLSALLLSKGKGKDSKGKGKDNDNGNDDGKIEDTLKKLFKANNYNDTIKKIRGQVGRALTAPAQRAAGSGDEDDYQSKSSSRNPVENQEEEASQIGGGDESANEVQVINEDDKESQISGEDANQDGNEEEDLNLNYILLPDSEDEDDYQSKSSSRNPVENQEEEASQIGGGDESANEVQVINEDGDESKSQSSSKSGGQKSFKAPDNAESKDGGPVINEDGDESKSQSSREGGSEGEGEDDLNTTAGGDEGEDEDLKLGSSNKDLLKYDTMSNQERENKLQELLDKLLKKEPTENLWQDNLTKVQKLLNSAADAAFLGALELELIKNKVSEEPEETKNLSIEQRAVYIANLLRAKEIIIQLKKIIEEEKKSSNQSEPPNSNILPSQRKSTLLKELSTKLGLKKINDDNLIEVKEEEVKEKLKLFETIVKAAQNNPKVSELQKITQRLASLTTNQQAIGILQEIKQRESYVGIKDEQYIIKQEYDLFNDDNLKGYKASRDLLNKYKPEQKKGQKKVDTKLVDESYFELSKEERKDFLAILQELRGNNGVDIKQSFKDASKKITDNPKFKKIIANLDTFVGQNWSEANTKADAIASTTAGNNANTTPEGVENIKNLVREIKIELEKEDITNAIENATVLQKHRTTQLKLEVKLKEINRNKEIEKKRSTKPAEVEKQLEMKEPDLLNREVEFSFEDTKSEESDNSKWIYIKFKDNKDNKGNKDNKDNKCGKFKKVTINGQTDYYVDNDGCVFKITDGKVKYQTIEVKDAFKYEPAEIEDNNRVSIANIEKRKNANPKKLQPALQDAKKNDFVLMYKKSPDDIFNILGKPINMPIGYERFGKPFVQKNDDQKLLALVPNNQDIDLGAINGHQRFINIDDNKLKFKDSNEHVTIERMVLHKDIDIEEADKNAMLQPSTDLGLSRQYVDTVVKSESLTKRVKIFGFVATAGVIAASFAAYEILKDDIIIKDIIAKAGINFDSLSSEIKQKLLNVDITETGILGKKIRNILNDGTLNDTNALDKNDIAGKLKNLTDSNIADTISKYQDLLIAAVIVFAVLLAIAFWVVNKKAGVHLMRDNQELTKETIEKETTDNSKFNSLNGVHLPHFAKFLENKFSQDNLQYLDKLDSVENKYQFICNKYYEEYIQKELDTMLVFDCDYDKNLEALKRFDPAYKEFLPAPAPASDPTPTDWASTTNDYKKWKIGQMKTELARIDKEHKLLAAMEYSWLDSKNKKTDLWARVGHFIGDNSSIIAGFAGFSFTVGLAAFAGFSFTVGLAASIATGNTEGIIACSVMIALFALFYIAVRTTLNKGKDLKDVNGVDKVTTFLGRGINKYWYVGLLGLSSILSIAGFLRFGSVPLPSNALLVVAGALMAFCILFKIAQSVYQRYKTTKEIIDICKAQRSLKNTDELGYRAGVYVGAFFGELPKEDDSGKFVAPVPFFAPVPIRGVLLTLAAGATASLAAAVAIKEAMGEPLFGLDPMSTMILFFGLLAIAFICNAIDKKYTSAEINKAYGITEKNTLIQKEPDSWIRGTNWIGNAINTITKDNDKVDPFYGSKLLNPIKKITPDKLNSKQTVNKIHNRKFV